jgi:hypothetical protein
MSKDYAAVFAPLPVARSDAASRIAGPLMLLPLRFTGKCYQLRYAPEVASYVFSGGVESAAGWPDVLHVAQHWAGVSVYHESPAGSLHVLLLNGSRPTETVVALKPDSGWVSKQQSEPLLFETVFRVLLVAARELGASFWFYQLDPALAAFSRAEFVSSLETKWADPACRIVVAVAAQQQVLPFDRFESLLRAAYTVRREEDFGVAAARWFPQVDDEE